MAVLWVSHGFPVDSKGPKLMVFLPIPMHSLRISCVFPVVFQAMVFLWISYGLLWFHQDFLCIPCAFPVFPSITLDGQRTAPASTSWTADRTLLRSNGPRARGPAVRGPRNS